MSRLTRDGTAEPVSRNQILRRERGQENNIFPCSANHVQDWQPYPVDPYSCYNVWLYINTYIHTTLNILYNCHKIDMIIRCCLLLFFRFSVLIANQEKLLYTGGQSRSWSAEQGKYIKRESLAG